MLIVRRGGNNNNRFANLNVGILIVRCYMAVRVCVFFIILNAIQAISQPGIYGTTHIASAFGAAWITISVYNVLVGIPNPTAFWLKGASVACLTNVIWLIGRFVVVNILIANSSEGEDGNDGTQKNDYDANRRFGDAILTMIMTVFYRYIMTLIAAIGEVVALHGAQAFEINLAQPPVETTASLASSSGRGGVVQENYSPPYPRDGGEEETGPPIAMAVVHANDSVHEGYGIPVTYATASAVEVKGVDASRPD